MRLPLPHAARAVLALTAVLLLSAFQVFGQPDGTGDAPDHPDDPRWIQFRGVKITVDKVHGVMRADFPPTCGKPMATWSTSAATSRPCRPAWTSTTSS